MERLKKAGADIISEACQKSFLASFERCKSEDGAYLLSPNIKIPRINPSNDNLRAEVNNHVQMFTKGLDLLPPLFHADQDTQTDPEV